MELEEKFENYLNKLNNMKSQFSELSEEATKSSLIMPFFSMLGYDVFDANEFLPEYTCDVGTKKGEKIDYAILKDGEPIVLIEAKRAGMKLQKQQQGQLYRYFSTNRCRIAILTNGITYQFFSDLNEPNIMDDEPFLSFNLIEDDSSIYLSSVKQFSKENFDVKNVISKAVYQKYAKVVEKTIKQDLISPSDEIVKYFLSRPEVKTGTRITAQMIEKYREITQKTMQKVMGTTINNIIMETVATSNISVPPQSENNVSVPSPAVSTVSATPEQISDELIVYVTPLIPEFTHVKEDMPDFIRIHLYTENKRKTGIVKISKADCSIEYKKIGSDYTKLDSLSDIKNYL